MDILRKEAFCECCGANRKFRLKSSSGKISLHGMDISISEQKAYCTECGKEIFIEELAETNTKARKDAQRKFLRLFTVA